MEIRRNRTRTMVMIITLFVLAVVVTGATLGYFWYRKTQQDQQQASSTPGGTVDINATKKIETEQLQSALVLPKSTDKVGDTIKLSVLSITVPKSWRTINGKNIINTPLENIYATSSNDILAQYLMVPETNPTDSTMATNTLSLYNITSWLKQASGKATPALKAAYIANITNLADGKPTDKTVCAKGGNVFNPALCTELLKPVPLMTSDGQLKGVAYLGTTAQTVTYDPTAFVFMTGTLKDQQVMLYGAFHLMDQNSHQLDVKDTASIKAAWDSFTKGTVPSDTQQLYQHVTDAIKSIVIQVN